MSNTKERKYHSSKHSSHHHHRNHHYSGSKNYQKRNYDPSSEMERRGENIIYDKVRKERIAQMIKRSIFVILSIAFILVVVYFMTSQGDTIFDNGVFNKNTAEAEINELKNKLIDYEYHIEYLENRLSRYENVDSIFDKEQE